MLKKPAPGWGKTKSSATFKSGTKGIKKKKKLQQGNFVGVGEYGWTWATRHG